MKKYQKNMTEKTPTGWAGPGRLMRRQDPPFRVAMRKKMKKGK